MCSPRSCPCRTPAVPVSTTHRTAGRPPPAAPSRAAAPWWRRRGCCEASGRLIDGADAVGDVEQHGESVMHGSLADPRGRGQTPRQRGDEPVRARQALGLDGEQLGRGPSRPVGRQQLVGRPGSAKRNFAPLVHEVEPGGEGRLVRVVVRRQVVAHQVLGRGQPPVVRRPQPGEVPRAGRVAVEGVGPGRARGRAGALEDLRQPAGNGLTQTSSASSAYPRTPGRPAACSGRPGPAAGRPGPGASGRPRRAPAGGRRGCRSRRGAGWRARSCGSRDRRRAAPARATLHDHPRDRRADRRGNDPDRVEHPDDGRDRSLAAAGAGGRRTRRTTRSGPAWGESASLSGDRVRPCAPRHDPIGDNGSRERRRRGRSVSPEHSTERRKVRGWRR